jgi:CubicO group peptidase (beta-lactamase class C family)
VSDLGRLARFLLGYGGNNVLPEDLRRLMLEPQTSRRTYGLGSERYQGRRLARHGGWFAAHKSHILIDLDAEIGIAVLANSDNADPDAIAKALLTAVLNSAEPAD